MRPYASVQFLGKSIIGRMDTGALVSSGFFSAELKNNKENVNRKMLCLNSSPIYHLKATPSQLFST